MVEYQYVPAVPVVRSDRWPDPATATNDILYIHCRIWPKQ